MKLLRFKDVTDATERIDQLPLNRGGARIGQMHVRKLKSLVWWLNDKKRRNIETDIEQFNTAECKKCVNKREVDQQNEKIDTELTKPGKLAPKKWIEWEQRFENCLNSRKGITDIPLNCVTRSNQPPDALEMEEEQLIHGAALAGAAFKQDNKRVFGCLKDCIIGTDTCNWIATDAWQ